MKLPHETTKTLKTTANSEVVDTSLKLEDNLQLHYHQMVINTYLFI